jgi:SAM-dependent methyltransferase
MATQDERRTSFNRIAEMYAAMRPGYPVELTEDTIRLSKIPPGGHILEIGCGPGTASVSFAERGYAMLCLELGDRLAQIAKQRLSVFPRVEVRVTRFEDWELEPGAFDLVLAASSFHWIDPEVAYSKSAAALRPGGSLAILRNASTGATDPDMQRALEDIYRQYLPSRAGRPTHPALSDDDEQATEMRNSGFFAQIIARHYPWDKVFDADGYVQLLETYSDHQTLPPETKRQL